MSADKRGLGRLVFDAWTHMRAQLMSLNNPRAAMRYMADRKAFAGYAAGSRKGPDKRWKPPAGSADTLVKQDWKLVAARCRDLVRNNPLVAGALEKICANVVYTGIQPQAMLALPDGSLDQAANKAVESEFSDWSEAVGWDDLQTLALRHCWEDGGLLLHWYPDPELLRSGLVPLRVEGLELDYLDATVDGPLGNGGYARRGIEYDVRGRVAAYHIYTSHPGDASTLAYPKTVRVPARWINHVFAPKRCSQHSGMPWLTPVVMTLRNLEEYHTNEQIAARLASAFALFIETNMPEYMGGLGLGGETPAEAAAGTDTSTDEIPRYIESGSITTLPQGTKISTAQADRPGNTFEPFTKVTLKSASAGAGMSYGGFSNDFSDSSYAAERRAALDERRMYRVQQTFLARRMLGPGWRRWVAFRNLAGLGTERRVPVTWQLPGWQWVDPSKDAQAAKLDLEMRITTRRRLCAERGLDFDDVAAELAREEELLGEHGLAAQDKEGANARA